MGKLINIDNGGTLTDICVMDGADVWRTKILTTPFDLSKCLMDGLAKASLAIYGHEDVEALLLSTDHIRYSTTQGTNALVERKGPRLGLIYGGGINLDAVRACNAEIFDLMIGGRVCALPASGDDQRLDAVRAVSDLAAQGANRIVIAFGGDTRDVLEKQLKRGLLRAFPPHLLGAVPILYTHEIVGDENDVRRTWTALFNAFLHPAMERFLYSAEQKLRNARAQSPLLIFRNDGQSARVAKTVALKTYSSGPRGGAEGARRLAGHYGINHLVSVDIGGTTTDISIVENGVPRAHPRGFIDGVETSFPLTDVASIGVGGSSIIRVRDGVITVGPDSVGSTPGPACFALGGLDATMTDAFFASGLLDPASFFGGALKIDVARGVAAVENAVAKPAGMDLDAAVLAMESAWVAAVANGIKRCATLENATVLAAFGGAGPFVMCKVAESLGITRILIPKLAAVFSAFGIGFSDLGHQYEMALTGLDKASVDHQMRVLTERAHRGMRGEGINPDSCTQVLEHVIVHNGEEVVQPLPHAHDVVQGDVAARHALRLTISKPLPHPHLAGDFDCLHVSATAQGVRTVLFGHGRQSVPVYAAADLAAGASAAGPAILEEEFFTCRIDAGWAFTANAAGDILITRNGAL
jgi:N-methylhydantoinase A